MRMRISFFMLFLTLTFLQAHAVRNGKEEVRVMHLDVLRSLLSQRNDTTYVVNFWATWCGPCIKEMPAFLEAAGEMKQKKVRWVLISLDDPDDLSTKVIPFTVRKNIGLPVYLLDEPDYNSWMPEVSKGWSGSIPATLIWKRNKQKFYEQPLNKEELINAINQFTK